MQQKLFASMVPASPITLFADSYAIVCINRENNDINCEKHDAWGGDTWWLDLTASSSSAVAALNVWNHCVLLPCSFNKCWHDFVPVWHLETVAGVAFTTASQQLVSYQLLAINTSFLVLVVNLNVYATTSMKSIYILFVVVHQALHNNKFPLLCQGGFILWILIQAMTPLFRSMHCTYHHHQDAIICQEWHLQAFSKKLCQSRGGRIQR